MISVLSPLKEIFATAGLTPSKSITNRALIIKALSGNKINLINPSSCEDSVILKNALENTENNFNVNNSGTAFRFLTAYLAIQKGSRILSGSKRMEERPIGQLVDALNSIGADIEYINQKKFPPLKISGRKISGGKLKINSSESSQFLSALLLIAPVLENGLHIEIEGEINSKPYIEMTLSLMNYFGVKTHYENRIIKIDHQDYSTRDLIIENDWSSASFWYEIAVFSENAEIKIKGLNKNSIQGDSILPELMKNFGIDTKFTEDGISITKNKIFNLPDYFEFNFNAVPDLVIPLAVICAALKINAKFSGVKNLRIKESDRLSGLKTELKKIGTEVTISEDSISLENFQINFDTVFTTYGDHRFAMAFAPLAMKMNNVRIDDHTSVSKSYPEFWEQLLLAGFKLSVNEKVLSSEL